MTKSAETLDGNGFAGRDFQLPHAIEDGDTGAKERG